MLFIGTEASSLIYRGRSQSSDPPAFCQTDGDSGGSAEEAGEAPSFFIDAPFEGLRCCAAFALLPHSESAHFSVKNGFFLMWGRAPNSALFSCKHEERGSF